jgi:hypothetical protein
MFPAFLAGALGAVLLATPTDAARSNAASTRGTSVDTAPARAAMPDSVPARTTRSRRRGGIAADIRLTGDTRVRQTLVAINKDSQDGQWILASNAGVPLLDRWRGEEESADAPTETTVRAIRQTAEDAGIEPTDTVIRILDRRIKRDAEIRRHRAMGLIERDADGYWRVVGAPPEDEESVDQLFARMSADAENADLRALTREIERQICEDEAMECEPESSGGNSPSCCAPK